MTREMNTVSRKHALWHLPLALMPVFVAAPVSAQQRDTGVVRTVSVWQKDVDQLRMDLLTQRRIEQEFQKMLASLQLRLERDYGGFEPDGIAIAVPVRVQPPA